MQIMIIKLKWLIVISGKVNFRASIVNRDNDYKYIFIQKNYQFLMFMYLVTDL